MTLLISAFTKNHAILASDRRLAYKTLSGKVVPGDDDACKLIQYDGRFLFAYTGPANLGGYRYPTDLWITHTLQYAEEEWHVGKAIENLAKKSKERISKYKDEMLQYFTVICVGWQMFKGDKTMAPFFGHVSTYIDHNFNRVPLQNNNGSIKIYFSYRKITKDRLPFIFTAGQELNNRRLINLNRTFRKFTNKNISQDLSIEFLYNEIIHASNENTGKDWIGRGVLAAAISLESSSQEFSAFTHGNSGTGQQFRYYPANSKIHIFKGPHAVQPGGTILTDLKVGYLEDPNDQYIEVTIQFPKKTWHMPWTTVHTYLGPQFSLTTSG